MKKYLNASDKKESGKPFNFRPALFSAAFFALGIAFAFAWLFLRLSAWRLLCAVPVLLVVLLFAKDKAKSAAALAWLCFCFSLGALAFSREIGAFRSCKSYTGEHTVAGTVTEKSDYGGFSRIVLSELYIDGERTEGKLAAALGGSFSEKVELSDRVLLSGTLETDVSLFGDYGFKSGDVLKGIRYTANVSAVSVTGKSADLFRTARLRIRKTIYAGMDEESASVMYALLTGDTSGMESGLLESVRLGGVAHIFAVSGLHVGALYSFCRLLIDKTRLRRFPAPVRFFLTAAVLVFYGGVCGFSASVVRALVMCLVLYASALVGIKSDLLENTGVAALFLLALHPVFLFDTGFLLSFAACLSIGVLSRSIEIGLASLFPSAGRIAANVRKSAPASDASIKGPVGTMSASEFYIDGQGLVRSVDKPLGFGERIKNSFVSFFSVSLAAQIGTAPVLLASFGYVSVWSLFLNCLFVPLIGAVFAFLFGAVLLACLLPLSAASAILYLPSLFWSAALLIFHAADFSFVLTGFKLGGAVVLYYAELILISDKINITRKKKRALFLLLLWAFVFATCRMNA